MFGRWACGVLIGGVCVSATAKTSVPDTVPTVPSSVPVILPVTQAQNPQISASDPQSLWGQNTNETIGKIEKHLTDLQLQSDTTTLVDKADFFTFSEFDSDTQTITPISRLDSTTTPIGLPLNQPLPTPMDDEVVLGNDVGLDPARYLPKVSTDVIAISPTNLADDSIQKRPNLISRAYDRIFNDGAGAMARLDARIFLTQSAHTLPTQNPNKDKDTKSDPAILVAIDEPEWRQDERAIPVSTYDSPLKKAKLSQEPFKNIKSALDNITVDSTPSFSTALPRLRQTVIDASRAVGYYDVQFRLQNAGNGKIDVIIDQVGEPVKITSHTLDMRGQMGLFPESEVIVNQSPKPDDVFDHGQYEQTKAKVDELGRQRGFFDGKWLEHSADVLLPDNLADVNLVYDSGVQYEFDDVVFFTVDKDTGQLTTDPAKLPVRADLLQKLVNFETGDGFDGKKVTQLSNELLGTRYFNATNVEMVLPEMGAGAGVQFESDSTSVVLEEDGISAEISPIVFDVSDDLLVKLKNVSTKANYLYNSPDDRVLGKKERTATSLLAKLSDGIKTIARTILPDESGDELPELPADLSSRPTLAGRKSPSDVFQSKKVPLYVLVIADKPKDAQIGLGWGSDTGMRATARLENTLLNKDGMQAGVEVSVSELSKGANVYVSRPLSHPINDKLIANTKYFEEKIAQAVDDVEILSRTVESGLSRSIIRPSGWNRTFSLRYRLDELRTNAPSETWQNLPVHFNTGRTTQEAVLVGASLSKTISDNFVSPMHGYRQYYSLELGSKGVISDTDMAIFKAGVSGMASFGNNLYGKDRAHQLIGRLDLGYIWADEFNSVPYKLRFFAGGDQSIRGYDYQSLAPRNTQGYLIGGQALAVGSVEYNYEIKDGVRTAVFADIGGAYGKNFGNNHLGQDTKLGVGVGLRIASPVGMVRVDIAKGIEKEKTPLRLHFLIGKPF